MSNLVEVPEEKRQPFAFAMPGASPIHTLHTTWQEWADYHKALGQELAKRMWEYPGPSTEDDAPPEGGTPVLMRMAA